MRRVTPGVLVALTFLSVGCAQSPESAVKSFYRAVEKGEITEAQTYVSAQASGILGPQKMSAAIAQASEEVQNCGGIKSVSTDLTGEGEIRSGTVSVVYKGECPSVSETIKLVKEDGKWKIGANK